MRRTGGDDLAARGSAFGSDVDDMVGDLDDVEVVLDDDDGVAALHEFVQHLQQQADIFEMESRRRLVEDIERAARVALRKFARQLDALALAARQRGAGLAEGQIAQSHFLNGAEFLVDVGNVFEKLNGHIDRHVQHVVDILALVFDFERLAVVTVSAARLAAHVNVGQEVHLDGLHARAAALLAAAALDVEREAARLEAPDLGVGRHFEEFADVGKDIGIGRRIAARRTADGRLIDDDQFVDMFDALDAVILQRLGERAVKLLRENRPQGLVDERRFARTADARDADELAQREFGGHVFEIVALGSADHDALARPLAERFGNFDAAAARQVIGRDGVGLENVAERSGRNDIAALAARAGPTSTMKSAARIMSSSCSTTITELPASRSSSRLRISLRLSR